MNKEQIRLAVICATLSEMAYRDFDEALYMELAAMGMSPSTTFIDAEDTQCIICDDGVHAFLIFRGTESLQDWIANLDFDLINSPGGRVHRGFSRALDNAWPDIANNLTEVLTRDLKLVISGHSQGGSLSRHAAKRLLERGIEIEGLFPIAPARDGDVAHADALDAMCYDRHFYFVNNNDIVPRVPPRAMGYSHSGQCMYFSEDGELLGRPGWLRRLLDRLEGRIKDLFEFGTDGVKDHDVSNYKRLTESLLIEINAAA